MSRSLPPSRGALRIQLNDGGEMTDVSSSIHSISLRASDWEARIPWSTATSCSNEILVLCCPPRIAAEIEAQRLPVLQLVPRTSDDSRAIRVELESFLFLKPTQVQLLVRR